MLARKFLIAQERNHLDQMCGQAGILIGKSTRPRQNLSSIVEVFTRLLVRSEHRGPFATGAAWLDSGGMFRVCKASHPASRLISNRSYAAWRRSIPLSTGLLLGHTRLPTQGSHLERSNNHPLVDRRNEPVLLTHNGNIPLVHPYFRRFGLPRRWRVDSELLVRLSRRHAGEHGIDVPALLRDISQCAGHIAAVLAWAAHPETVILIRRDRPLWLAWYARQRLLAYASERSILTEAIGDETGWRVQSMDTGTALVFKLDALPEHRTYDFE